MYLYRAVDSSGQTLDSLSNETRITRAARRFFRKVLGRSNVNGPGMINVDKNPVDMGRDRKWRHRGAESVHRRTVGCGDLGQLQLSSICRAFFQATVISCNRAELSVLGVS